MAQSKFQFQNPVLTKLDYAINEDYNSESPDPKDLPLSMQVQVSRQEEESAAYVRLIVSVAEQNPAYPFFLSASMVARFQWNEDLPPKLVDTLLRQNAPSLLLSYLRPYIAQITGAGPGNPIHIPFMDFTHKDTAPEQVAAPEQGV